MLTLLFAGHATAQAPKSPDSIRLANGISLQFVKPTVKPDYDKEIIEPLRAIQKVAADKARQEALQAAEDARIAEQLRIQQEAQAEADRQAAILAAQTIVTQVNTADDSTKLFIYNHESGNDPTKWNSSGCFGLGQNCPAYKGNTPDVLIACPNMNYTCEDAWFTNYANQRYGGWQGSYNFWLQNSWW